MLDTWVQSLGREDALEKGMATHSTTLAWRIPWTEAHTVHGVAQSWTWLSLSPFFKSKQAANVYKVRESQMKWGNEDTESKKIMSLLTPGKKGPCLTVLTFLIIVLCTKGICLNWLFVPLSPSFEECFPNVICLPYYFKTVF